MNKLNTIVLAALLCVSGCISPAAMKTQSGKPEVTIKNQSTDTVKNATVRYFINKGFMVEKSDAFSITIGKRASAATSFFFGSPWDPVAYIRIVLNAVDMGNGNQKLIADPFIVSNRGGGYERNREMGTKAMIQIQNALNEVALTFGQTNSMPEVETASSVPLHSNRTGR